MLLLQCKLYPVSRTPLLLGCPSVIFWARHDNLQLNTSKTEKLLLAHGGTWTERQTPPLRLGIERVSSLKILSVPGLFSDGTRRYGVPAPFFQSKEKNY